MLGILYIKNHGIPSIHVKRICFLPKVMWARNTLSPKPQTPNLNRVRTNALFEECVCLSSSGHGSESGSSRRRTKCLRHEVKGRSQISSIKDLSDYTYTLTISRDILASWNLCRAIKARLCMHQKLAAGSMQVSLAQEAAGDPLYIWEVSLNFGSRWDAQVCIGPKP